MVRSKEMDTHMVSTNFPNLKCMNMEDIKPDVTARLYKVYVHIYINKFILMYTQSYSLEWILCLIRIDRLHFYLTHAACLLMVGAALHLPNTVTQTVGTPTHGKHC